jgi:hypothetical protein
MNANTTQSIKKTFAAQGFGRFGATPSKPELYRMILSQSYSGWRSGGRPNEEKSSLAPGNAGPRDQFRISRRAANPPNHARAA